LCDHWSNGALIAAPTSSLPAHPQPKRVPLEVDLTEALAAKPLPVDRSRTPFSRHPPEPPCAVRSAAAAGREYACAAVRPAGRLPDQLRQVRTSRRSNNTTAPATNTAAEITSVKKSPPYMPFATSLYP